MTTLPHLIEELGKPYRAHRFKLEMEADTVEEIIDRLQEYKWKLGNGSLTRNLWGGCSSGGYAEYQHDPDMTPERYHELNDAFLAALRARQEEG